jgi:meiosis-specific transcription factor NDT80
MLGTLHYATQERPPAKVTIIGTIDKGFFMADGEWTCYRRNYFSCVCSFTLNPYYPGVPLEYTASGTTRPVTVQGFAVGISAVVSDNDQHTIELVQHTPKRDKGPIKNPDRVSIMAKHDSAGHGHSHGHSHMSIYTNNSSIAQGPGHGHGHNHQVYPDGWVTSETNGNGPQTEWTFERIQFKQATQNNGKRRAAQQFYHILVELYANTGDIGSENWVKIAQRKSAKMIVRGRSPGHYQNGRQGSAGNLPPGTTGPLGGYQPISGVGDFTGNPLLSTYGGYDTRSSIYTNHRHHALPPETLVPPEEEKAMEGNKGYSYYPGAIYEGHSDQRIELFNHSSVSDAIPSQIPAEDDVSTKIKSEYSNPNTLPRLMNPASSTDRGRCGPFEGKPNSNGYYPHVSPSMGITMP